MAMTLSEIRTRLGRVLSAAANLKGEDLTLESRPDAVHMDWLFVLPPGARGWILDAICREIASRHRGPWSVVDGANFKTPLRDANAYFFAHFRTYLDHVRHQPELINRDCYIWYTHPRRTNYSAEETLAALNAANQIFVSCSAWKRKLDAMGVAPERSSVVIGGADPKLFRRRRRTGDGFVGLSSSFYERKRPDLVLEIVQAMPHRRFLLLGRNWEQFERFNELIEAPNFDYFTGPYEQYPAQYRRMDVILSPSTLEGGPIPLIEAMMSNVVPVASRTGFAPDIIEPGRNGFLFEIDAGADTVAQHIEAAFALGTDVRAGALQHTWRNFAHQILDTSARLAQAPDDGATLTRPGGHGV